MKIISICQPHFIPWIGYFYMIKRSNKFIFLDDVQYNRRSWQNRVHIRSSINTNEKKYLSLSVKDYSRSKDINQVFLLEKNIENFRNQVINSYRKSENFESTFSFLNNFLEKNIHLNLSDFNILLIQEICKILKIELNFKKSSDLNLKEYKKEHLILKILQLERGDIYLSNEGSKNYVSESFFETKNIKVIYNQFTHPIYKQFNSKNFTPNLSIIDLIFNCKNAHKLFIH